MGEYIVMWDWVECFGDGNGCEVIEDVVGNIVLVKRCFDYNLCEGYMGEDSDFFNFGVNIGEMIYCDGMCVKC